MTFRPLLTKLKHIMTSCLTKNSSNTRSEKRERDNSDRYTQLRWPVARDITGLEDARLHADIERIDLDEVHTGTYQGGTGEFEISRKPLPATCSMTALTTDVPYNPTGRTDGIHMQENR